MYQPINGPNEESPTFHGREKKTHEENMEEHQAHQDAGDNPNRRLTNENFGDTLRLSLHQYHRSPTQDSNRPHRPVTIHIQPGK